jgi:hypothetical protein
MAIPEHQLQTWSNQGATTTSASAYASIKNALEKAGSPVAYHNMEIYLQGSYRNATNIYGDSDIDVVAQLNATFQRDISALAPDQVALYNQNYPNATYLWQHFRADVFKALQNHFGAGKVTPGTKSIKVVVASGRPADVVPALHYRHYQFHYGRGPGKESYTSGIWFQDSSGVQVINYPKLHIENGESKNSASRTNGAYKPGVRMFKNARNKLIDDGVLVSGFVPSYFLECLLYNVPDQQWRSSPVETYVNVVNYLDVLNLSTCNCQNEQLKLIGSGSTQWNQPQASALVAGLVQLWNNW